MIEIPEVRLNISRSSLPQIPGSLVPDFLDHVKRSGIDYKRKTMPSNKLQPSQGEFNEKKVKTLMSKAGEIKPILVSKDDYVLDGHHRWLADYNSDNRTDVIQIDLPILDLITFAKAFDGVFFKDVSEHKVHTVKRVIRENLIKRKVII